MKGKRLKKREASNFKDKTVKFTMSMVRIMLIGSTVLQLDHYVREFNEELKG